MKSYPYMAFAEDFGISDGHIGTYTGHRIAFFTKKTGAWQEITVDERSDSNSSGWNNISVVNNGSMFCLIAYDETAVGYNYVSYISTNEGMTWTAHPLSFSPVVYGVSLWVMISANGLFGVFDEHNDGWWSSADGIVWSFANFDAANYSLIVHAEWSCVDEYGTIHVALSGDDNNVYYVNSKDFVNWTRPIVVTGNSTDGGWEGLSVVCKNNVIVISAHDFGGERIIVCVSKDNGATWVETAVSITAIIGGDWQLESWVISRPLSLLQAIVGDDLYLAFTASSDELDYPDTYRTFILVSHNISSASISFSYSGTVSDPFEMWWFSGAAQDPVNDNGWMLVAGYSLHVYDEGVWVEEYSRRCEEIDPITGTRTLIYELEGTTSDYLVYWPIPNGAPSSWIRNGFFCAGCYREFSRGGFAYFF